MPSFFTKLLSPSPSLPSKNPYAHPTHPSNPTTALQPPPSTSASRTFSPQTTQPQPQSRPQTQTGTSNWNDIPDDMFSPTPPRRSPRPASPLGEPLNYLAEARQVLGRDPVTGRASPYQSHPPPSSQHQHQHQHQHQEQEREKTSDETSMYRTTTSARIRAGLPSSGTKYDIYVQEMKARKGGRWRAPGEGFYAPEREVGEYYGGGGQGR